MAGRSILGVIAASALSLIAGAASASAVSVTNRDDTEIKISIVVGESREDHVLKPSQVLENVCATGCVIRLKDSENDEYELEGSEVVSIEAGNLYYDGPDATPVPNAGTEPAPSPAGQK